MIKILTSNNSTILRELGSPAFGRLGVQHVVVSSGQEALEVTRAERPAVAVLDVELPDGTGYDFCRQLKEDARCGDTRVVLLVEGAVTAAVIARLSESRCDEVLVTPMSGEALFHKIAQLLGLPRRLRRRMAVELEAEVAAAADRWAGRVADLNQDGARLELDRRIETGHQVHVRIRPGDEAVAVTAAVVVVRAKVVWDSEDAERGGWACGVQFVEPDLAARTALMDLSLWEVVDEGEDGQLVILQGDFREHTDFSRLRPRLHGVVRFDLAWVRYLNSAGVKHWVNFLRSLQEVTDYRFLRASVAFVTQAAMVPEVLGQGQVESFLVPYACDECDLEEDRLLQLAALAGGGWPPAVPDFACPRCKGDLVFDDLPQRYFAFLEKDPRLRA
jgi:CheY-like chemotaxis protein